VLNIVNINKKWFTWLFLLYLASFLISYFLSILNFNIFDRLPNTHKMKAQIIKIHALNKTQIPIATKVKPTNTITPQIKTLNKTPIPKATILPIESHIIIETPTETKYIPIINKTPMITPTPFYTIKPTIVITPQPTINTIVPTIMPTIIPTLEPTIIIEDIP